MSDVVLPTASALPRAFRCRPSAWLPQTEKPRGEAALKGTEVHAFLERVGTLGREAALAKVEDEAARRLCEAIDLEALPVAGSEWAGEVAFEYNLATHQAREVGRGVGREYPRKPGCVYGTADLVAVSRDRSLVYVLDFKTGFADLGAPEASEQLRFLALCAARVYGALDARVGFVFLREDGSSWTKVGDVSTFDLDLFAADVVALAKDVSERKGNHVEGPHCRYCPAFNHCSAKTGLLAFVPGAPTGLTTDKAAVAWDYLDRLEEAAAVVREKLKEFARDNPFLLPSGQTVGPVETSRDELDGRLVYGTLLSFYGEETARAGVELEASKKSVDRAMRKVYEAKKAAGEKATLKGLNEHALEQIRLSGGLSTKTKVEVKPHKVKPND